MCTKCGWDDPLKTVDATHPEALDGGCGWFLRSVQAYMRQRHHITDAQLGVLSKILKRPEVNPEPQTVYYTKSNTLAPRAPM